MTLRHTFLICAFRSVSDIFSKAAARPCADDEISSSTHHDKSKRRTVKMSLLCIAPVSSGEPRSGYFIAHLEAVFFDLTHLEDGI